MIRRPPRSTRTDPPLPHTTLLRSPSLGTMPSVAPPPREVETICLLRLSALGDVTHVLPLVHTLQRAWPGMPISWIIGRAERRLLEGLPGVTFLEYDKRSGVAGMRALRRPLQGSRLGALPQLGDPARAEARSGFAPA